MTHFKNRTLRRLKQGDKDATLLAIHYEDGMDQSTKFFVVSLDKSTSDKGKASPGWSSKRKCIVHKFDDPVENIPDFVDEIIEQVQKTAEGSSIWKRGLINRCVDSYFSED